MKKYNYQISCKTDPRFDMSGAHEAESSYSATIKIISLIFNKAKELDISEVDLPDIEYSDWLKTCGCWHNGSWCKLPYEHNGQHNYQKICSEVKDNMINVHDFNEIDSRPLVTDHKIVLIRYMGGQIEIQTFDDCMELADKLICDGDIGDGTEGSQMHILAIKNLENRLARYKKANNIDQAWDVNTKL